MFSTRFNSRLDASHHDPCDPLKDTGIATDSVTGIHNAMKCLSLSAGAAYTGVFGAPTAKSPEDSNLAKQDTLLYLSIGHEKCYREHLAQRG
jgi:hypothetical protein